MMGRVWFGEILGGWWKGSDCIVLSWQSISSDSCPMSQVLRRMRASHSPPPSLRRRYAVLQCTCPLSNCSLPSLPNCCPPLSIRGLSV